MADYWSVTSAVEGLGEALGRVAELKEERLRYEWEAPPSWTDDMAQASADVRDAVRFLCSPEADD